MEKNNAVVTMAKELGHEVLFTPPYHSDLQPIELIWAKVKGEVAKQYDAFTTFSIVKTRLELAFANVDAAYWTSCINHVKKIEIEHFDRDQLIDELDITEETEDGEGNDTPSDVEVQDGSDKDDDLYSNNDE